METRKYSLGSKLGYAIGDVLGGGAFALLSLLFLNFLVTMEGMSAGLAGAVVMVGKIWDAVTDPLMGAISDRTRSRFGRRRVYLLVGALPIILTFTMLWYSFGIESQGAKFVYYSIAYILFSTAYTIVTVPYNALLPDMVEGYKNRAGYSTTRILVSNISATLAVTLPNVVLGNETTRTPADYLKMGLIFGCMFGIPLIISFFTTWENPNTAADSEQSGLGQIGRQFAGSFRNRAYRQYLGIFIFGQLATDVGTAVTAFWLVDQMHRTGLMTLVSAIVMLVGLCMLPVNNWIAKKYGKHCPAYITLPFRVAGLAIAFFLGPQTGMPVIIAVSILNGIGAGTSSFVPWTLLPDLPDSGEMMTGTRNAGIFAGMSTFVRKFTSGVGIFLVGVALQLFGYVESTGGGITPQTPMALLGIRILFTWVPIALTLVAIFLGARYTLTKKNHALMCAAIEYKRSTGKPTTDPAQIKACEEISGKPFNELWVGQ